MAQADCNHANPAYLGVWKPRRVLACAIVCAG